MDLPEELVSSFAGVLGRIEDASPVGGGCVSQTYRLAARGGPYFAKAERAAPPGFFAAEAAGLGELRAAARGLTVPEVVAFRDDPGRWSWMILEWLAPGPIGRDYWERLGEGMAELHAALDGPWGWERDGFIGSLPQANDSTGSWADFWYERRILPQLELARGQPGIGSPEEWDELGAMLPDLLLPAENEGPSSLHGDLWSGNVLPSATGPALIDPAYYRGHREVDLAMMALFGGFDQGFDRSYGAVRPLEPGHEIRKDVYQLYYLLVHVNLFGASYAPRTAATLWRVLNQ